MQPTRDERMNLGIASPTRLVSHRQQLRRWFALADPAAARSLTLEPLEARMHLCAVPALAPIGLAPALAVAAAHLPTPASRHPLVVPAMHSLDAAPVSLYLDFDGDFTDRWLGQSPGVTPALDSDGDPTTFSDDELTIIAHIWERVAELFSPFNIDVTTEDPGVERSEQTLRIVIGGDGAWGGGPGGLGAIDSFSDPQGPNLAWVFVHGTVTGVQVAAPLTAPIASIGTKHASEPVVITTDKTLAEAIAHEAGHALGLQHQRTFNPDGSVLSEYNGGTPDRAPIMGTSAQAARALWWLGPSQTATTFQDDVAVLTRPINLFGYRTDDAGDTVESAVIVTTPSASAGVSSAPSLVVRGVISTTGDRDVYAFTQAMAGHASIRVDPAARSAMLDAGLDILDAQGQVIDSIDTASLGETMTISLPAGRFYVVVRSHGDLGDIGQYTLTVHPDVTPPTIASLTAPARSRSDGMVPLSVRGAADADGRLQAVRLFLDADGNGVFHPGKDTLLGEVTRFKKNGRGTLNLGGHLFAFGDNTVFAVPRDDDNADGAALAVTVRIQPPVHLLASPKVAQVGDAVELTAADVMIVGTEVARVRFYRDVNLNHRIDPGIDTLVGVDTDGADGWSIELDTNKYRPGNHEFIAVAVAANGRTQRPGFTSVFVNTPPRIKSLTIFREPELPFGIFSAKVDGLRDAQGTIRLVDLFLDSNGNNQLDKDDQLLVTHSEVRGNSATLRFAPGRLLAGVYRLFAVAEDFHGGRSLPANATASLGGG